MARSATFVVILSMLTGGPVGRCLAEEALLAERMAAYRAEVLARAEASPAAPTSAPVVFDAHLDARPADPRVTPWRTRVGPAYPHDPYRSVAQDLVELPATLWDDTIATFTDPGVLVAVGVAGAAGIAINGAGCDDAVARRTAGHRQLPKALDSLGGSLGSPAWHFPIAAGLYGVGLLGEDDKLYETSKALINALALNGAVNIALKAAANTEVPNGDENGWPSGHTSSSFVVAAVLHEAYGPWVGVPLYAFAAFVGYERIDARNHDLSDVVSGAILGTAIGWAVANHHRPKLLGMDVLPMADPGTGTVGVMLVGRW
ncbi:MAG: phosphatase PAP2 family protein [Planctomycetota bacterium]